MTKEQIIKLYIADLNNLVADTDAKRNRIMDLEDELEALKQGQLLPIDSVSNRLFDGIEIHTVDVKYFIGYDTYDDDMYCYVLSRKVNNVTEILLEKRHRIKSKQDKDQFKADINKLAELFSATVNGC